ncbi:MAG: hypothetical protein K0R39_1692, partial [Symbiobacteriaceae bacterium]|nr:hypothetical protein [Symbiobacteriaceae bacterium]
MWRPDQILIDRLTARIAGDLPGGGAALRLRLARALEAADLRPGSMPPSGVLIIRRISRELPAAEGAWAAAMDGLTAGLWEQAGRPAEGPVAAGAEAVRFADEAEMLAALAADVATGAAWRRWWWQAVLRQYQVGGAADLRQLLVREPRLQPAVWHHLARQGQAETVAGAVAPGDALQVMALLARTFGLDGWGVGFGAGAGRPAPAPWPEAWVGPVARLGVERAGLVGLAVSLHRRPGRTASAGFVQAFRAWWVGARAGAVQHVQPEGDAEDFQAPAGTVARPHEAAAGTEQEAAPGAETPWREVMQPGKGDQALGDLSWSRTDAAVGAPAPALAVTQPDTPLAPQAAQAPLDDAEHENQGDQAPGAAQDLPTKPLRAAAAAAREGLTRQDSLGRAGAGPRARVSGHEAMQVGSEGGIAGRQVREDQVPPAEGILRDGTANGVEPLRQDLTDSGAAQRGEAQPGEAQRGEAQRSDAQRSDAQRSDAQRSDAQRSDAQRSEALRGEAQPGEAQRGEAQPGEAQPGEAQRGDAQRSDAQRSEAQRGDAQR